VELLAAARRSLEDFDSASSRIGERVRESSQTLSVSAGHIVAASILPLAMKEFLAGRPELSIEVSDDDLITTIEKVSAGSPGLGIGSIPSAGGVRRTLFFRFSLMVIRTDSDTAPHRASTTWSGLKGERLIVPSLQPVRSTIEQNLARRRGVPSPDGAQSPGHHRCDGRSRAWYGNFAITGLACLPATPCPH
jgi:DNA-binding transcriptional LysR family regulator